MDCEPLVIKQLEHFAVLLRTSESVDGSFNRRYIFVFDLHVLFGLGVVLKVGVVHVPNRSESVALLGLCHYGFRGMRHPHRVCRLGLCVDHLAVSTLSDSEVVVSCIGLFDNIR